MKLTKFEYNGNENSHKCISKDIICPKCRESCKIDLKDYKIFYMIAKKTTKLVIFLLIHMKMHKISQI